MTAHWNTFTYKCKSCAYDRIVLKTCVLRTQNTIIEATQPCSAGFPSVIPWSLGYPWAPGQRRVMRNLQLAKSHLATGGRSEANIPSGKKCPFLTEWCPLGLKVVELWLMLQLKLGTPSCANTEIFEHMNNPSLENPRWYALVIGVGAHVMALYELLPAKCQKWFLGKAIMSCQIVRIDPASR